ncbi:hypothetical protein LC613_03535 [Nostoc sphaeroides CHAB 2801]|uniref:Uncharacterized protein n=2 Tax=Nostoc sphaeroides TaxID=446679 RepID=A0A5P8W8P4_9NOSO|nr:hypothetical protein [Nostoc sphaeroides]MCC5627285.1 hypothetical protein [Nostoc sphaeroides CHAB 2801]QFS49125.1 hypothetical protein GXM_06619 [Nostoc sphaeroides CCNUC1]
MIQLKDAKALIPKYTVTGLIFSIPEAAIDLDTPDYCQQLRYILQIGQNA